MWGAYAVAGFAAGVIQTGTLQGGLIGAFSAVAFYAVGSYLSNQSWATNANGTLNSIGQTARVVGNGIAGGVTSELQGGKFGSGFISAGVSTAAMPTVNGIHSGALQYVATAMVGGTASVLSGGKFVNGAESAVMQKAISDGLDVAIREAREDAYARRASTYNRETALAVNWDVFGFGALIGETPGSIVRGEGEGVALGGYSNKSGWYTGDIGAAGVHVGSENYYFSHVVGREVTTLDSNPELITIDEIGFGVEVPFTAGAGLSVGRYSTPGDSGYFLSANGGILGQHAAIGVGGSVDFSEDISRLYNRLINSA